MHWPQFHFDTSANLTFLSKHPIIMSKTNKDSYLWIVLSTFLRVVAAAAVAIVAASLPQDIEVPRDVARDMVDEFIREENIMKLNRNRGKRNANQDNAPTNKRQRVNYDHERARVCVQDDWMGPVP